MALGTVVNRRPPGTEPTKTDRPHTVELDDNGLYGVWLEEIPLEEGPSTVAITTDPVGTTYTEVSGTPAAGEFRVYYRGSELPGFVEFNSAQDAQDILVDYKGTGSPAHSQQLNAKITQADGDARYALRTWDGCIGRRSTGQSVPSGVGTWTKGQATSADEKDTNGYHDPSTNNGQRFVAVTAGMYEITVFAQFNTSSAGTYRGVRIYKDGVGTRYFVQQAPNGTVFDAMELGPAPFEMAQNEYLEVAFSHDVGANLDVQEFTVIFKRTGDA